VDTHGILLWKCVERAILKPATALQTQLTGGASPLPILL